MATARLDPMAILAALGVTGPATAAPVHGGFDTAIWRVEHGGARYALRVFRPEQAPACQREVAAMRAAAGGGIPVPAVHAEGVWHDRPALVLDWLPGRTLAQELRARPWRLWPLALAFGRMHARIHAVAAPAVLHESVAPWMTWAGPVEEPLRARLEALAPPQPALLHFDYHPLNVLTDGRQVTAVLDWTNVRIGDPRADVTRTFTILAVLPPDPGALAPIEAALRRLLARGWRRGYEQVAGPLGNLAPFYAWAGQAMLRDLAPRPGRAGMAPAQLEHVRRWTEAQRRAAGLPT
jgi:aminoglycoside phosphotransferase (APT) family kinase protein